MINEITYMIR